MAKIRSQRPGLAISARCPSGVRVKVGEKFGCGVLLGPDPVNYTVTITAVAGGDYASDAAPTDPIIDTQAVMQSVVTQEGSGAAVTCGRIRFVQLPVNSKFACQVTKGGHTDILSLSVSDNQGDVTVTGAGVGGTINGGGSSNGGSSNGGSSNGGSINGGSLPGD